MPLAEQAAKFPVRFEIVCHYEEELVSEHCLSALVGKSWQTNIAFASHQYLRDLVQDGASNMNTDPVSTDFLDTKPHDQPPTCRDILHNGAALFMNTSAHDEEAENPGSFRRCLRTL